MTGDVEEIELSAEVRGEEGNTVMVRVNFDQTEAPRSESRSKNRRDCHGQNPLRKTGHWLRLVP